MTIKYLDAKRIRGSSTADLVARQGYDGGLSSNSSGGSPAGGGGGSSAIGGTASGYSTGGVGGAGTASDILITDTNVTRAGGGGGGTYSAGSGGAGGSGGGGIGGSSSGTTAGGDATANTGSGGGGGARTASGDSNNAGGGDGGSGIVVLRFLTSGNSYSTSGSPTVTTNGSHTVVKYLASGTFTPAGSFDLAEYLVIAGGGGGGSGYAGGGGSGGYRTDTAYGVTAQAYTVTIGAGGAGGASGSENNGVIGSNSVFGSIISIGGGYGAEQESGGSGGSGGGAGWGSANVAGTGTGATSTDEKATLISFPDTMGTDADGTISGASHSTSSPPVGSGWLDFDGSNDYFSADGVVNAMTTVGTISCWFKFDVVSAGVNSSRIWQFGASTGKFVAQLDWAGKLEIDFNGGWGVSTDVSSIVAGTWYQLVITHNGTAPIVWLGALGSAITEQTNFFAQSDKTKWIADASDTYFDLMFGDDNSIYSDGGLAEFACWNVVLTDTQISDLHNASGSGVEASTISSGLRVHFNFNTSGDATNTAILSSNLPANTIFEETDTYGTYFLQDSAWQPYGAPPIWSKIGHWFDSSDINSITKDGSNLVSQWNDKKGTDNLVQATGGDQPLWTDAELNSKAIIDFAGNSSVDNSASSVAQPNTHFIVLTAPVSDGTSRRAFKAAEQELLTGVSSNNWLFYGGTTIHFSMTVGTGWQIWEVGFNGASSYWKVGNVLKTGSIDPGDEAAGAMQLAHRNEEHYGNNKFAELIQYNGTLTDAEKTSIYNYLKDKWGL